jgi:hypothetical protein
MPQTHLEFVKPGMIRQLVAKLRLSNTLIDDIVAQPNHSEALDWLDSVVLYSK